MIWELDLSFHHMAIIEFKCTLKALFYAFCYGSDNGQKTADDFVHMCMMGGEL